MIPLTDGRIQRSDLPDRLRVHVKDKERYLNRVCKKLWTFTNPNGERFIFGKFMRDRDELIVTVSRYEPMVGWIWAPFHYV